MTTPLGKLSIDQSFLPTHTRRTLPFEDPDKETSHLQIYHANSIVDQSLTDLKSKKRKPTQEEIEFYSERKKLIHSMQDQIESHLDRRIELFFQQAILCYRTPFIYEAEGAEDQIGKGGDIQLSKGLTHYSRAAHSSTLPCLYACPKNPDGTARADERFVFLKHSHVYNQHNATIELPIEVNNADSLLDKKSKEQGLRTHALTLINSLAKGTINPTRATRRFLKLTEQELIKGINKLEKTDLRRKVFTIYLSRLRDVREELKTSPELFDQIMGVNLGESDGIQQLREIVYKKRFTLIQESASIESQIAKRIFLAQKKMIKSKCASLSKVDYRLRYALLQSAKGQELRLLEKLFCTSIDQLNSALKKNTKRRVKETINAFKAKHIHELTNLQRELRIFHRSLVKLEFTYRSELFKGLRKDYKQLLQREFVAKFLKKHPEEAMSQAMVSRIEQLGRPLKTTIYKSPIEQRRKMMNIAKAEKIADTFGIDVGLFLPGLIASDY